MVKVKSFNLLILIYFITLPLMGCGLIKTDGLVSLDDPAPNAPVLASGTFSTINQSAHPDATVTGAALVYKDTTGGFFIVRLQGFSAPNQSGLEVAVDTSSGTLTMTLKGSQGNENYTTSIPVTDTRTWNTVFIRNTTFPPSVWDYAQAILTTGG